MHIRTEILITVCTLSACAHAGAQTLPGRQADSTPGNPGLPATPPVSHPRVSVDTQRIGVPGTIYLDPEFWEAGRMIIWQEQVDGSVWIADIDESDGSLIPADGRGRRMGYAAPITRTLNGPEFGYHVDGPDVYYIGWDGNGVLQAFRTRMWIPDAQPEQLTRGWKQRFALIPNYEPDAPQCRLLYYCGWALPPICWRHEDDASSEDEVSQPAAPSFSGPRWIPNEYTVIADAHVDDVIQVLATDVLTGQQRILTDDPGNKKDPFIWDAPDLGGRAMMCLVDVKAIGVYREVGNQWVRINTASVGDSEATHYSAEPFVFRGHSYASVAVGDPFSSGNKDIWIVSLDPQRPLAVRVHEPFDAERVDPESYITADGRLFLYFYHYPPDGSDSNELYVAHVSIED